MILESAYAALIKEFISNNMLTAGVGTVVVTAILALLRNVPFKIYFFLKSFFSVQLTLNTKNSCYNDVAMFSNTIRINATSRTFSLARRTSVLSVDESKKYHIVVGYGTSYGTYKGRLVIIDKEQLQNKNDLDDQLTLTFLTRNKQILKDFLEEATKEEDNNEIQVFASDQDYWYTPIERAKRSMDTVFINKTIKEDLINSIKKFQDNKQWYVDRGIPYKLCICLYGNPGTGKTSLIHTIASEFNMNIRYVSSLENISSLINSDITPKNDIVVIEDIDALGSLDRKKDDAKPDKKIIHNLLNVLDGLKTREGMIIIMTTNHVNKLDAALKRAGRIDKLIEITSLDAPAMKQMFLAFYGKDGIKDIDKFIKTGKYKPRTGAELQDIFLTSSNYKEAIERISNGKV